MKLTNKTYAAIISGILFVIMAHTAYVDRDLIEATIALSLFILMSSALYLNWRETDETKTR